MPIDPSIPLQVRPVQMPDPMQAYGNALAIRSHQQQARLNEERLKTEQLENQQRQQAADYAKSLGEIMQRNVTAGSDGLPVVNHVGVVQDLVKAGHGAKVSGYMENAAKVQKEQAEALKTNIENRQKILADSTQMLQGVSDDAGYQRVLPGLLENVKKLGLDPQYIPRTYDENAVRELVARGTAADTWARSLQHATDIAVQMSDPKRLETAEKSLSTDVAGTRNQAELNAVKQKYQALGTLLPKGVPNPYEKLLANLPTEWSPELAEQARLNAVPMEKQPGFQQKTRENDATALSSAARRGKEAYAESFYRLPAERRTGFVHPDQFDAKTTPSTVVQAGMTPAQRTTAEATAAYRDASLALQRQRVELERLRVQLQRERTAKGSNSADDRQAFSLILGLEKQEDALNRSRTEIGAALKEGRLLNGKDQPVDASSLNDDAKNSLRQAMEARYRAINPELKRVVRDKYDQFQRLGTTPSIPLEEVSAAIDAGDTPQASQAGQQAPLAQGARPSLNLPGGTGPIAEKQPSITSKPPAAPNAVPAQQSAAGSPPNPAGAQPQAPNQKPAAKTQPQPSGQPVLFTINGQTHRFPNQNAFDAYLKANPEFDQRIPEDKRPVKIRIDDVLKRFPNKAALQKFKTEHPEYSWK